MASLHAVHAGLEIFKRYGHGHVAAEYDGLYAGAGDGPPAKKLTAAERARLRRLGWHWDELAVCWHLFT